MMTEPKVCVNSLSSGAAPEAPSKTAAQRDGNPAVETSSPFMGPGGMSASPDTSSLGCGPASDWRLGLWCVQAGCRPSALKSSSPEASPDLHGNRERPVPLCQGLSRRQVQGSRDRCLWVPCHADPSRPCWGWHCPLGGGAWRPHELSEGRALLSCCKFSDAEELSASGVEAAWRTGLRTPRTLTFIKTRVARAVTLPRKLSIYGY